MRSPFGSLPSIPRTLPILGLFLALLPLVAAPPADAASIVRVADEHLAHQAALGVEGTIVDGGFVATDRGPATVYELRVERVWLGELAAREAESNSVRIRVPGGVDPSTGELKKVFGAPQFAPGERVFLLLDELSEGDLSDGARRPLHLLQGVFRLAQVEGEWVAYRHFVDTEIFPLPGRKALAPEGPRQMASFGAWLADLAEGRARPADYRLDLDVETLRQQAEADRPGKFTFIELGGRPTRWPQFDSGGTVTWRSHSGGQPGVPGGGHSQFQSAINAWNNDGGSRINLRYGGQTGNGNGLDNSDFQNVIVFDDIASDISGTFSCTSGGTVATTSVRGFTNQTHVFQGTVYVNLVEADIAMQDGIECFIGGNNYSAQVYAHELGHGLGLGHSCDLDGGPPGSCNTAVKNDALMRAQLHQDNRGPSLRTDDRNAINVLYNQPTTTPAAPSGLGAVNVSNGIRLDWLDNSNNETSFRVERRVGSGSFQEIGSTGTNDDDFVDTSVNSGVTYGYRVRASNGAGSSDYSNTATITASGEPAPSNLAAQVLSPTQVRLTWNDNASGETAYEVESDGFGVFVPAADLPANSTSVTLAGLNPSTTYDFRVRAVGSPNGDSSYAVTSATLPAGTPEPCTPGDTTLCLNGERFKVEIFWEDAAGVRGLGNVVPIDPTDSGLFYFFDENNWELLIKVLDGCALTNHFWVFAAATTDVEYTLVVTDTVTGTPAVYTNPLGNAAAAITDTGALPVCNMGNVSTEAPAVKSMSELPTLREARSDLERLAALEGRAPMEVRAASTKEGCMAGEETMCLTGGRFQLTIDWDNGGGGTGSGKVVTLPIGPSDSGLFYFFDENNWEMLVKVLDACVINDRFWVLAAATTDVGYTLVITDTQESVFQVYGNPAGNAADALIDTNAFATCP